MHRESRERKAKSPSFQKAANEIRAASTLKKCRLDFNSWFNLWHTHNDWKGQANASLPLRRLQLSKLLALQNFLRSKVRHRGAEVQVFVWVYEKDPGSDAVYMHSANPYNTPFPHEPPVEKWLNEVPRLLQGVVGLDNYRIGRTFYAGQGHAYYLERRP